MNKNKSGKLFVVAAPSGSGKTSITNQVLKILRKKVNISKFITYTTRKPRIKEKNGKDYYFISKQEFENKIIDKFFIEITEYNGEKYGSAKSILTGLANGKSFILITDINGVKFYNKIIPDLVTIWIAVKNVEELKKRILKRGSISLIKLSERLKIANKEIKMAKKSKLFKYIIVNNIFKKSVEKFCLIIKKELDIGTV